MFVYVSRCFSIKVVLVVCPTEGFLHLICGWPVATVNSLSQTYGKMGRGGGIHVTVSMVDKPTNQLDFFSSSGDALGLVNRRPMDKNSH